MMPLPLKERAGITVTNFMIEIHKWDDSSDHEHLFFTILPQIGHSKHGPTAEAMSKPVIVEHEQQTTNENHK